MGHCDASEPALGRVVGQTNAAIVQKAGERPPTLEHVVHRLGEIMAARELGALCLHINV